MRVFILRHVYNLKLNWRVLCAPTKVLRSVVYNDASVCFYGFEAHRGKKKLRLPTSTKKKKLCKNLWSTTSTINLRNKQKIDKLVGEVS